MFTNFDTERLVNTIKKARYNQNMSVRELSERSGITPDTINNIFRGKSTLTAFAYVCSLCRALKIPIKEAILATFQDDSTWDDILPTKIVEIIQPAQETLPIQSPADQPHAPAAVDLSPLATHLDNSHVHMGKQVKETNDALINELKSEIADLRKIRRLLFWIAISSIMLTAILVSIIAAYLAWELTHPNAGSIQWQAMIETIGAQTKNFLMNL